jgi:hypothetical protein
MDGKTIIKFLIFVILLTKTVGGKFLLHNQLIKINQSSINHGHVSRSSSPNEYCRLVLLCNQVQDSQVLPNGSQSSLFSKQTSWFMETTSRHFTVH